MHMLLVDDSKSFRDFLTRRLQQFWPEATLEEYDPGRSGAVREDINWRAYDAILLDFDLGLDNIDGFTYLRQIRELPEPPVVIMITGEGNEDIRASALSLGAVDYFEKYDISLPGLVNAIRRSAGNKEPALADTVPMADLEKTLPMVLAERRKLTLSTSSMTVRSKLLTSVNPQQNTVQVQIPGYNIIKEIAKGGMATVFLAEREEDRLEVVLKVVFTDSNRDPNALKRFMQEYELLADLTHPNVVRIYERAFASGYAYIALEYFPGGDLVRRIRKGIEPKVALTYLQQIAEGLSAVHQLHIIHRDLKPGNVLFKNDDTLALTDFGMAKLTRGPSEFTSNNVIVGTPYYMSPEQAGRGIVDHRSDLYSMGIIFYQMLTGKRPYTADTVDGVLYAHIHNPIPRLPEHLERHQPLVDGLLAKDQDERFQTAGELLLGIDYIMRNL